MILRRDHSRRCDLTAGRAGGERPESAVQGKSLGTGPTVRTVAQTSSSPVLSRAPALLPSCTTCPPMEERLREKPGKSLGPLCSDPEDALL